MGILIKQAVYRVSNSKKGKSNKVLKYDITFSSLGWYVTIVADLIY